jgi:hypothetical protein
MPLGNDGIVVQDQMDLNETVLQSFPHVAVSQQVLAPLPEATSEHKASSVDEKAPPSYDTEEKQTGLSATGDAYDADLAHDESGAVLYDESGREKVLETAQDFSIALCSLEDDPTMPIFTFRMWFAGIGQSPMLLSLGSA